MNATNRLAGSAIILLLGVATLPAADDKPATSAYYPLKIGNSWTYKVGSDKASIKVARVEMVGKQNTTRLETTASGNMPALSENILVTADGVFRAAAADRAVTPPLRLLTLPPKDGSSWEIDVAIGDAKLKGKAVCKIESSVKVPAGTYTDVVVISSDLNQAGQKVESTCYYAKDVGMIKQILKVGSQTVTLELEKFQPAK